MKYKGSCLCGAIRYEIAGELSEFGYCHCRSCRKASGSAHGANAGVRRDDFRLQDDDGLLREFESSPGKRRTFCARCGSPLFAYLMESAEVIRVRLGSLDTPLYKHAKAHTFVGDKAEWEAIDEVLPQFDQWASKDVLVQLGSRQQ